MKTEHIAWSQRYRAALRQYLDQGAEASLQPALGLGRQAAALGLKTLDLATVHEQALMTWVSRTGAAMTSPHTIRRAKLFFSETLVPCDESHRSARKAGIRVQQLTTALRRRTRESSDSTQRLAHGIDRREAAEAALKQSRGQHARLLAEAQRLQKHLRRLTHEQLTTQEAERQKASRHLHDEIAQTLLAINIRLLVLKTSAKTATEGLKKEIVKIQRMVKESIKRIHRFAHEYGVKHKT